jgi:hypothetical protein
LPNDMGARIPVFGSRFHSGGKPSGAALSANTRKRPSRIRSACVLYADTSNMVGRTGSHVAPTARLGAAARASPTPHCSSRERTICAARLEISATLIVRRRLIRHFRLTRIPHTKDVYKLLKFPSRVPGGVLGHDSLAFGKRHAPNARVGEAHGFATAIVCIAFELQIGVFNLDQHETHVWAHPSRPMPNRLNWKQIGSCDLKSYSVTW